MARPKFLRMELGLSQWELASASGVPRWAIQLIESDVRLPELEQAEALARTLGSTVAHLFPALASQQRQEKTDAEGV